MPLIYQDLITLSNLEKNKGKHKADCLSRASINQNYVSTDMFINDEQHQVCASAIFELSTLTADVIKETEKDQDLVQIKRELKSSYINSDCILNDGILIKSNRIVTPKNLQPNVLRELYSTHIGITKMKHFNSTRIWKTIDKEIGNLVKCCQECSSLKHSPAKAPIHHCDIPRNNWDRIHIDYAVHSQGFYYLLVIDAKSCWAEMKILQKAPNSAPTMKLLNEIFVIHGYTLVTVSDNATIFTN